MRAAVYARVSTAGGDQNPEMQVDELVAWAGRIGCDVHKVYVDRVSGTKSSDERPALRDALRDAHERRYDVLLVWALDRLSRGGIGATAGILERLKQAGVGLKSLREPWLDSVGPVGEVIVAVLAWVSQQERARIVERVRAGVERAKRNGTKSGKPIGRPRASTVDGDQCRRAVAQAGSLRKGAALLGISTALLRRRLGTINAA